MGKVYKFSDIADNHVPQADDFARAKTMALDELSRLVFCGSIYGAKVFGSVAKGTPNERSDFDLLVITQDDLVLEALKEIFETIVAQTKVEIEPIVVSKEFAKRGFHSIEDLFLDHIRSIPNDGNVAGNDPLEILKPFDLPSAKVHEQYLAQKIRRLKEGFFTNSEVDRNRVLQRALEAPVNVGRRTLQVLPQLGYPIEIEDDSKQTIIHVFQETFKNTILMPGFNFLLDKDEEYTLFLKEAVTGNVLQEEYEHAVSYLAEQCIPQAITWTSEISLIYMNLLEGSQRFQEGSATLRRGKESFGQE